MCIFRTELIFRQAFLIPLPPPNSKIRQVLGSWLSFTLLPQNVRNALSFTVAVSFTFLPQDVMKGDVMAFAFVLQQMTSESICSVEILGFPVDAAVGSGAGAAAPLQARAGAAHIDLSPVGDGSAHLVTLHDEKWFIYVKIMF